MRVRSRRSWIAGVGASLVVVATFVSWGSGEPPVTHGPIFGTSEILGGESAWHAFPVIAGLIVVAALLSFAVHLFPLGSDAQQAILGGSEAIFALIVSLATWLSPPRAHSGLGEPLAWAGALLLLVAATLIRRSTPPNP